MPAGPWTNLWSVTVSIACPFSALTFSIDYVCVEGVSFPFSFQCFTRLAAVFAEEVGENWLPVRVEQPMVFGLTVLPPIILVVC